ncbi:MAG: lysozyme [Proteobacteria bacterium]|nr:lysozyme [Pseudomonadota bacterium]
MTAYTISNAGLALIQDAEGFRAEAGQLPNGAWVIGYGHVRVGAGEPVNQSEAANLLVADLAPFESLVNEKIAQPLTQSQFDALVSFAFSIGADAFEQSQVLRRVNAGEFIAAACAMDAWRKSDVSGDLEIVDALVRRRSTEKALFLKDVAHEPAPSAFLRAKVDHAAAILGAPIRYAQSPAIGSIAAARPKAEAAVQIAHVLKSEPATEVLLLTQVVSSDFSGDEITTAHAKPVSRKVDAAEKLPIDRRIRSKKYQPEHRRPFDLSIGEWLSQRSFGAAALVTLMVFGLALVSIGVSMLLKGNADGASLLGASAFSALGIAAVLLATWGLLRTPRAKVRAD